MKTTARLARWLRTGLSLALVAVCTPALAQDNFYAGTTLKFVPAFPPGASIDRTTRMIAAHIGKHIPGNPTVIVENMPGAGGVIAANYIYNAAPKDGTVLGVFNTQLPVQELIGQDGVDYQVDQYNWVGSLSSTRIICYVRGDTNVYSMDDLLKPRDTPILYGSAGAGNHQTTVGNFLKMVGAQIRIVPGYPSIQNIQLAMEQGEVQATCSPWEGLRVSSQERLSSGLFRIFVQDGQTKAPDLPDAQLMVDAIKDQQHLDLWAALTRPEATGRAVALPPDVPADRVEILRRAYDAVMVDPEFIADMAETGDSLDPTPGEGVEELFTSIMQSTPEVIEQLKTLYTAE